MSKSLPLVSLLGGLSAAGYAYLAFGLRGWSAVSDVGAFLACLLGLFVLYLGAWWLTRRPAAGWVGVLLFWAVVFRLLLLFAGLPEEGRWKSLAADLGLEGDQGAGYRAFLLYDNDVWRYLWDGHVLASGLDPYALSPLELEELAEEEGQSALHRRAEELFTEERWLDVYDNLSYTDFTTVYPPLAQGLFALLHEVAPASVFVWKLTVALFDLGTCLLLCRLLVALGWPASRVVIYAWNPLVIKELAGSGHLDGVMIFFLVAAVTLLVAGRRKVSSVALGAAILTKLTPVLLVPLFLRRTSWRSWLALGAVVALGFWPFRQSWGDLLAGLSAFSGQWVFNPGAWGLVGWLAGGAGATGRVVPDLVAVLAVVAVLAWGVARDRGSDEGLVEKSFWVLAVYLCFSATVMPWYLLWALPLATVKRGPGLRAWIALCALSLLSYLIYIDQQEKAWWLAVEHGGFVLVLAWEVWRWRRLPV